MKVTKGVEKVFAFTALDDNGTPVNLNSYTIAMKIYNNFGVSLLYTIAGAIVSETAGTFSVTLPAATSSALTKYYYPYSVELTKSGVTSQHEVGILNANTVSNNWEWQIDMFTGVTLAEILVDVKDELRYNDWSDDKLTSWVNKSIEDFCRKTEYIKAKATMTTKYGVNEYLLPDLLFSIDKVEVLDSNGNPVELFKNLDWTRRNNTLVISTNSSKLVRSSSMLVGNQTIVVTASKYAQALSSATDYLEFPKECDDAVTLKTTVRAMIEDRREASEISILANMYISKVEAFADKQVMDSLGSFQVNASAADITGGSGNGMF